MMSHPLSFKAAVLVVVAALGGAALVAACGGGENKEPANSPTTNSSPQSATTIQGSQMTTPTPTPMSPPPASTSTSTSMSGASASTSTATATSDNTTPPKATMTDGEIVAIASAANTGEIDMAKVAQKSAKDPTVKSFAEMMIKDHTEAETKGKKIAEKGNITPQDNETSTKLKSDVGTMLTSMKSQTGAGFDRTYMDAQVKAHRDVLSIIDTKLIPNAKNTDLKTHLSDVRTHVSHHLTKAEEISQKLEGKASTTTTK